MLLWILVYKHFLFNFHFFGMKPGLRLLDPIVNFCLTFKELSDIFHNSYIWHSHQWFICAPISSHLPTYTFPIFFDDNYHNEYELEFVVVLVFSPWLVILSIFHIYIGSLDSYLEKHLSQPFVLLELERLEVLLPLLGCGRSSCTVRGTFGYIDLLIPWIEYCVLRVFFLWRTLKIILLHVNRAVSKYQLSVMLTVISVFSDKHWL